MHDAANYLAKEGRKEARHAIVILTDDQTERDRDDEGVLRALGARRCRHERIDRSGCSRRAVTAAVDEEEPAGEVGRAAAVAGWAEAGPVGKGGPLAASFSVDADRTAEWAAAGMGRSS